MKFGRLNTTDAAGAILAHSLKLGELRLKKGHKITPDDIASLQANGCETVVAAQLEEGDIDENQAAGRVAAAVAGEHLSAQASFGGRSNLYATEAGLLVYDRTHLDQVNMVNEAITVAALDPFDVVDSRQVIATVKIIPYGLASTLVEDTENIARSPQSLFRIATFRPVKTGLIQTRLQGSRESVLNKTRNTLETRLRRLGCQLALERRCEHEETAIARALGELRQNGCGLFLIIGASATADRRDVVPTGIENAGGQVLHLGMPVEPGNLLLFGKMEDDSPVIGLPGCARSPVLNGVDWIFERLLAGLEVESRDIMCMGAGGYIKGSTSIPATRQHLKATKEDIAEDVLRAPEVAAVILAAGMSRRMGNTNKLLEQIEGEVMVKRVVRQVLASQAEYAVLIAGHQAEQVRAAVADCDIPVIINPEYASGLSSSLQCGLKNLPPDIEAAIVCLADMPAVGTAIINQLIAAFDPAGNRLVCVPVYQGQRGNPVLLARQFFSELGELSGDTGARGFLEKYADLVCEVEVSESGILEDIDNPESLHGYRSANY